MAKLEKPLVKLGWEL